MLWFDYLVFDQHVKYFVENLSDFFKMDDYYLQKKNYLLNINITHLKKILLTISFALYVTNVFTFKQNDYEDNKYVVSRKH